MATDSYVVRLATGLDAAAVDALLQASYPALMASAYDEKVLTPALKLMARANPSLLASGTYYVAESPHGLVGCGGWTPERPGTRIVDSGVAHIRHFGTHAQWIRRGIGRAIYEVCETTARFAGVEMFECHASLNGVPFYTALGFARINSMDVELQPGLTFPAMLMRRRLLPPETG